MALSLLSSYRTANPQLRGGHNLTREKSTVSKPTTRLLFQPSPNRESNLENSAQACYPRSRYFILARRKLVSLKCSSKISNLISLRSRTSLSSRHRVRIPTMMKITRSSRWTFATVKLSAFVCTRAATCIGLLRSTSKLLKLGMLCSTNCPVTV